MMKKSLLKQIIAITIIIIVAMGAFMLFGQTGARLPSADTNSTKDLAIVPILVKAGYTPNLVKAPADKAFILRMTTQNTYDCSAALTIPALHVDQFLPAKGDTDFVVEAQPKGTIIAGGCSMGMYGFQVIVE